MLENNSTTTFFSPQSIYGVLTSYVASWLVSETPIAASSKAKGWNS